MALDATPQEVANFTHSNVESVEQIFRAMKAAERRVGAPTYEQRMAHLDALGRMIRTHKHAIAKAISADFGNRSKHESFFAEVMVVALGVAHAKTHLHEWMETEVRHVSWLFAPGRAEVMKQPLGVIGIISPWNYPVQLALGPLVAALAAGNRAILRPSELTPETSALLEKIVGETFEPDHVRVVTGGVEVADALARMPLDHLLFTGSTRVGKLVMRAAAENLTPVTLELGGKSPAIVGGRYNLKRAAEKILTGKCLNSGQTCIAPDYVLVPHAQREAFVDACREVFAQLYPSVHANPDYTSIVNEAQRARVQRLVEQAREQNARIVDFTPESERSLDAAAVRASRKMALQIVLDAPDDSAVMTEEIFGPVLPVVGYATLEEAIAYVNDRPKPLALYYFDNDDANVERVLRQTISGGVTINDTILHIAQDDLPFGGVGPSGMGMYHAREGFEAFSKKKPIFYQSHINSAFLMRPPFGKAIEFVLKMFLGK